VVWKIIGIAAASLTMFSFVPQIFKVYKTKSGKDLSLITLVQLATGVFLWIIYGVYLGDRVIIVANAVTLSTLIILLVLYFLYAKGD